MSTVYYIDGYNVIHVCPELQKLARRDFEAARESLIERVSRYAAASGETVSIIFDGRGRGQQPQRPFRSAPGLNVVYSAGHQSADTLIERQVYSAQNRREIVVVSGDRGIRDLCRGLGAMVLGPDHFLAMVDDVLARTRVQLKREFETYSSNLLEDRLDERERNRLIELKRRLHKKK